MKNKCIALVIASAVLGGCFTASVNGNAPAETVIEKTALWPEGKIPDFQEHQKAAMSAVARQKGFKAEENRMPFIEWCVPPADDKKTDICMILISGGGYGSCCDDGLVEYWRKKFTEIGVQCVNLVYRTPRPKGIPIHQTAWQDGQRAVRLVRSMAEKRGFNPEKIGTISMSAGSHLALLLATSSQTPAYQPIDELDKTPCHINFAITCAIAYALTDGIGRPNARGGDSVDVKLDSIFKFDEKTAPMCMFHGGKDAYSPFASTMVYRRLRQKKVPAELHLYADRNHGFFGWGNEGTETSTGYDNWFARAEEFMRTMNFFGKLPKDEKVFDRFNNDEARATYEKQDIWPEGKTPDFNKRQCKAFLEWHMPKTLKTKAIQILYSGGAYNNNKVDGFEVTPLRRYLNQKGMACVTVQYRTPRPGNGLAKHITAWQDIQRAVRIVRSQAAKRGLDPDRIGVTGCSAGGHLTLMAATSSRNLSYWPIDEIDKISCKVQWAIPVYPAYVLTDGANGVNKNGGNGDEDRLVRDFSFDLDTPPMCFLHGDADGYASMNSVKAWEQLCRMGIQSDLHSLATRHHCFHFEASPGTGSHTAFDRIWEFFNHKGINK